MDKNISYGDDYKYVPTTSIMSGEGIEVLPDLFQYTIQIVNIHLVGNSKNNEPFVLIDAGMPHSAKRIISAVEERFGIGSRPEAIILTHGHFDHVGALVDLIKKWNIPVFAHKQELPYLTGEKSYPEPDWTVEGGAIAKISPYFPKKPIDLSGYIDILPENHSVPFLDEFSWIHTPGHSPGQVALFRKRDRTLIAADTFATVKQEYLYKVMMQKQEISGPPRYFTTDWDVAKQSIKKLAELKPTVAVTGHGRPMRGNLLTKNLEKLLLHFDTIAKPAHGKYIQ